MRSTCASFLPYTLRSRVKKEAGHVKKQGKEKRLLDRPFINPFFAFFLPYTLRSRVKKEAGHEKYKIKKSKKIQLGTAGLEPATIRLKARCSTSELRTLLFNIKK